MKTPKEFYKNYLADNYISDLNRELCYLIKKENPVHVLEFGCGTGKNLHLIKCIVIDSFNNEPIPELCGMDLSFLNFTHCYTKNIPFLTLGDETHLRHLCNFDVVFTCSVLDHIENIDGIIDEFKRIANKCIFLAETNDSIGKYYFPHDYESYGFEKLDYEWQSQLPEGDGARYNIWKWVKE